jgi:hypothetical protein
VSERAKEDLLGILQHEDWIHTLDLNLTVDQRPDPVVVAYGDGQLKLAHGSSCVDLQSAI